MCYRSTDCMRGLYNKTNIQYRSQVTRQTSVSDTRVNFRNSCVHYEYSRVPSTRTHSRARMHTRDLRAIERRGTARAARSWATIVCTQVTELTMKMLVVRSLYTSNTSFAVTLRSTSSLKFTEYYHKHANCLLSRAHTSFLLTMQWSGPAF